ncbi:MAG: glycosyltransferase family 2 protein [Candidatus Binatia bacterium]
MLIPVYNRERYVADAIDSILVQTFTDFELLVIDDGSTDATREIVRSYRDRRIRLVCNTANLGIPRTRNAGIELARGEYLAFLDSDDCAYPERLAKQVAFLDRHREYAAVGAWIRRMDEQGRSLRRVKRKPIAADDIAAERLFRSCLENSASMARTAVIRQYGHHEEYDLGSDFDLWVRIVADHKLATLPEVLVRRRMHGGRTTQRRGTQIAERRLTIFAAQLTGLGIRFTASDLQRHYLLRRMQKMGFTPGRAYLDWARAWLLQLRAANQIARCYPEPAFSQVLGLFWLKVCWYAPTKLWWAAWQGLWRSPLRRAAWRGLCRRVWLYAPRRFKGYSPWVARQSRPVMQRQRPQTSPRPIPHRAAR